LLKICIRFLYPKADILIGVSKGVTRDLQQNFGLAKSVITVNNGVFINKINQKKIVTKLPEKILITASRLEQQKDNENLIKAFYFLQKNIPNVKLWILGEGSRRSKLEEFVKKLNLENNVTFFGWVNNIDKYLTQADLFILSSKREGLPYVLLEAMKYGLPIISTNSPFGPSEVLDGGKYGLLVPVGNASALNKSMYNLLINRHLYNYYSKRSIERVRFFSEKKMLREYEKIFAKLVLE
jgi:glycosyltransferase involved in cell wall biosynthesis